jgi:ankyrin repeat protein
MFWATKTRDQSVLCILIKEQLRQSKMPQYEPLPKHNGWSLEAFYLHEAAENGWARVVKLLLENVGADLLDPQKEYTPLCVAARNGRLDVVVTLLGAQADHNYITGTTRDTPLGLAIQSGKKDVVKALIDVGVERTIKLTNAKRESPKVLAQRYPGNLHHDRRDGRGKQARRYEGITTSH